jgi:hypothetical protein
MVFQQTRKLKLFSLLALVVTIVESVPISCPYTSAEISGTEPLKSFIVLLNTTSPATIFIFFFFIFKRDCSVPNLY